MLVLVLSGVACSDDSGTKPKYDAARTDSGNRLDTQGQDTQQDTQLPDLRAPDLTPAVDLLSPDTLADLAVADATADLPIADAPVVDTRRVDSTVTDGPIADRPSLDGADGPARDVVIADRPADAPVDAPAPLDAPVGDGAVDGVRIDGGNALVARGKYLVDNVVACSDCHTPTLPSGAPDPSKYLAGNPTFVLLPDGSALPSKNLTPHSTGLGNYTDQQIKRMFMDGIAPSGDGGTMALNSVMPYYVFHNMASQDADAIVAYLRSVPAVNNPIPERSPAFDVAAPSNYLDPSTIPSPATSYPQRDSALRGRYLAAESGLCIECHTPHLASGPNPIDSTKFFQGGEDFSAFFAGTLNIHPVSANLTSDPTTGLGDWTAEQIVTVLLQGKDDHGDGICPPMPAGPNGAYGGLTAQDALDIANYIKSLPPAVHDVPDMCTWPPAPALDGGTVDSSASDGLASSG
jgi:mono/diheme cytochrome c family protein